MSALTITEVPNIARESIEDEVAATCGAHYQALAVVCKFHLGPLRSLASQKTLFQILKVKAGERRFVVVADIVEKDSMSCRRSNCYDRGRRVVGGEVRLMQFEHALVVIRREIPYSYRVIA